MYSVSLNKPVLLCGIDCAYMPRNLKFNCFSMDFFNVLMTRAVHEQARTSGI